MKLLVLGFLSLALCMPDKSFNEKRFDDYSQGYSVSEQEFARIGEFISRVQTAKNEDLVSEEDAQMILNLGFNPLYCLSSPRWDNSGEKEDSKVTWGKINDFCKLSSIECDEKIVCRTVEYRMPFVRILKLFYRFESVDSLSREGFFDFFFLLDYLQAGKQRELIVKMESLNDTLGATITNSHLQAFANQSEEVRRVAEALLSPGTLSVNFPWLKLQFGQQIIPIVTKVLKNFLAKWQSFSLYPLEMIEIKDLDDSKEIHTVLFKILEKNSKTLTSLSIRTRNFLCPRKLKLDNLTKISIELEQYHHFQIEFLIHQNYTVLEIQNNIEAKGHFWQKKYFGISNEYCPKIDLFLFMINENKNLKSLTLFSNHSLPASKIKKEIQSAVSSLKYLESFRSKCYWLNPVGMFHSENRLHSLDIVCPVKLNWPFLGPLVPHLKHLRATTHDFLEDEKFADFITASKLEFLSIDFRASWKFSESKVISAINQLESLKKVELRIYTFPSLEPFELAARFEAFHFVSVPTKAGQSSILSLPPGPGVKYLKLECGQSFTLNDIRSLKAKFPGLNLLILPEGVRINFSPVEIDFQIRTTAPEEDDQLFNSVPSIAIQYRWIEYNPM